MSPPGSRGATETNQVCAPLETHRQQHAGQGGLRVLPAPSSPGRGDDDPGNENLHGLSQDLPPPLSGSFVSAENGPETHPAVGMVCHLPCAIWIPTLLEVTETSACPLEIQGSRLIMFPVSASCPPSALSQRSHPSLCRWRWDSGSKTPCWDSGSKHRVGSLFT